MIAGIDFSSSTFSPEQQVICRKMLRKYVNVFPKSPYSGKLMKTGVMGIDVQGHEPIRQKAYPVSLKQRTPLKDQLDELVKRKKIYLSDSAWASPIVLVVKKDGTFRFCVDYRKLNAVTRKNAYRLPKYNELLDAMDGMTSYTTMDMISQTRAVGVATAQPQAQS